MLDFITNFLLDLFSFYPFQLFCGVLCVAGLVRLLYDMR